ncbi:MAG: hypothetical protein HY922_00815 [Elusimicrobia bacterium]|nr:hypothetical protein [Elusimicrobiota bacterium]
MPAEQIDPAKNAAADIVAFAKKRPLWQQDALRRLAVKGTLSPQDLAELLDAMKVDCKTLPAERNPPLSPLTEAHLTSAAGGQGQIRLKALGEIANVNQLKPGETLAFAPAGITLVYGDNGSGKSGYSRIFKAASAARSVEDILADVFVPGFDTKPPASATFQVLVNQDGKDVEQAIPWRDREAPPDVLRQIRVFDRKGAVLYVKEKTDIEFVPFNLDLLDRLGSLCLKLKEVLQAELSQFDTERKGLIAGLPIGDARTTGEAITETATAEDMDCALVLDRLI